MPNIIEYTRKMAIEQLFTTNTFDNTWNNVWKNEINTILGTQLTPRNILNLGDKLGDIFRLAGTDRGQSGVASAGNVWEALICWYLNLCLANTRVVVIKQSKNLIPFPIKEAITVSYGNFPSNTEADLIAITFPNHEDYENDITAFNNHNEILNNNINIFNQRTNRFNYKGVIDFLTDRDFNHYEVAIMQCKTNWNDNAQIPMLWDMIYSAQGFGHQISVGRSGYSIGRLHKFTYSFITVPTVSREKINPRSTQVKRVANLSGGNYWGYPSQSHVANSVKEIINRNFATGTNNDILTLTLPIVLTNLNTTFNYFRLI